MFEFIRTHNRLMQFILLLLIFPAFVAISFYGYSQSDGGPAVATIAGDKITQADWDREVQRVGQELRQQNPSFDIALLDEPAQKYEILEQMLQRRAIQTALSDMHLQVSDRMLAQELSRDPSLDSARNADGQLDPARYEALLANAGFSVAQFHASVRTSMSQSQMQNAVGGTALSVATLRDGFLRAALQQRSIEWLHLPSQQFVAQTSQAQDKVQAYYDTHQDTFKTVEEVDVQYTILRPEAVLQSLSFSDAELESYFEQNQARFAGAEERQVRHIMFNWPSEAEAQTALKSKAQTLVQTLRQQPDRFAALAKQESEDAGSADEGGLLGYVTQGATGDPTFDAAVFALNRGEISDVVQTQTALHIIQVQDIRGSSKSFAEVKDEVLQTVRAEQGAKKYAETVDLFRDAVEDNHDLAAVAEQFKLPLETLTGLQREDTRLAELGEEVPAGKLLKSMFTAEALEGKHNTPALEMDGNAWISVHVTAHRPAKVRPLAEVREQVLALSQAEQAQALAAAAGKAALKEWQAGRAPAGVQTAQLSRLSGSSHSTAVVEAVMQAKAHPLPAWVDLALPNDAGYAVIKITAVAEPATDGATQAMRGQMAGAYQQAVSNAEYLAFIEQLKAKYKVKIKVPKPQAGTPAEEQAS